LITSISSTCFGRNYRPKYVELIEVINKLLLLPLVGCLYYYRAGCSYSGYFSLKGNNLCELQSKISDMNSEIVTVYSLFRLDSERFPICCITYFE